MAITKSISWDLSYKRQNTKIKFINIISFQTAHYLDNNAKMFNASKSYYYHSIVNYYKSVMKRNFRKKNIEHWFHRRIKIHTIQRDENYKAGNNKAYLSKPHSENIKNPNITVSWQ